MGGLDLIIECSMLDISYTKYKYFAGYILIKH